MKRRFVLKGNENGGWGWNENVNFKKLIIKIR